MHHPHVRGFFGVCKASNPLTHLVNSCNLRFPLTPFAWCFSTSSLGLPDTSRLFSQEFYSAPKIKEIVKGPQGYLHVKQTPSERLWTGQLVVVVVVVVVVAIAVAVAIPCITHTENKIIPERPSS